ncbi:MAG: ABC transporter permease [Anaerolineae bacterium]|nr:ABC transporter permease [Anaerolineae bacterium]
MRFVNRLRAIFFVVAKRLLSQPGLIVVTVLGLVIAIALMISIPMYADAVYYRIFQQSMSSSIRGSQGNATSQGDTSPEDALAFFPYLFRYDGSIYGTLEWEALSAINAYMAQEAANVIALPQRFLVQYFATEPFGLYAETTTTFNTSDTPLIWLSFSTITDLQEHITLVEGTFPSIATGADAAPDAAVEVLISEELAFKLGLQAGEQYIAFFKQRAANGSVRNVQIPVLISGIWTPTDPQEPFWFFSPDAFSERMLVPLETFTQRIAQTMNGEIYTAIWYLVFDGSKVTHADSDGLIRHSAMAQQKIIALLPNTRLPKSPVDAMLDYRRSSSLLTILLYAFSVPIFGLLLAFITLTSGLAVDRRRNEVAVLRSRGAMALQMVGIAGVESLLLGLVALAFSVPTGMSIAQVIGQARSFLDFGAGAGRLRLILTPSTLRLGLVGVALVVAAQVLPTLGAAGHTVVSYKREVARMLRPPWWQRMWLDILLLIPAGYGAYLLRQQGSVILLQDVLGSGPLQNPLLFLVPAIGIFALTLLFLRLMPLLMSVLAWIAANTRAVGLLMALRHLARTPSTYVTPLILLVLTLSLSAFTASLAYTLDEHLYDQHYYQLGADLRFTELGAGARTDKSFTGLSGDTSSATEEEEGPRWFFLPVSEYLNAPGAAAVTRVGRYEASTRFSNDTFPGVYMGVDRAEFDQIAFWRQDFAEDSLRGLMNALALTRNGILIPRDFMKDNALYVGDMIRLEVMAYEQTIEVDCTIVGTFDLFPTWYPSEGPLFVGNLEYLFEQAGGLFPYDVWVKITPDAGFASLSEEQLNEYYPDFESSLMAVHAEQKSPERQGLFGLLSVGFAAAAVLTVLGFLLYALFSFRRRFIEFGVLRAVGLSAGQMTAFLGWELAFLIGMGGGLGTILGGWVSAFFIPFLQVGVDEASRIPAYVVDIAWPAIFRIYALFGILFFVALFTLIVMLRRMRIFEAVKLGETA